LPTHLKEYQFFAEISWLAKKFLQIKIAWREVITLSPAETFRPIILFYADELSIQRGSECRMTIRRKSNLITSSKFSIKVITSSKFSIKVITSSKFSIKVITLLKFKFDHFVKKLLMAYPYFWWSLWFRQIENRLFSIIFMVLDKLPFPLNSTFFFRETTEQQINRNIKII
jgi:hypothetical protein